ncbi:class I SAM-dependent methyltransferase [Thermocrispum agreste]|jgi:hypothetical protein|uniref:class I SAM-dependent methyltransferase n=1 Tax=Thermocrispum agreste TaxID=37925 RepID=UPI00040ABCCB|nr:class I SAM-dependent methyltransferase [Thermocrispum agreste]
MTPGWVTADWLALREPADAAARTAELVDLLAERLSTRPSVVVDLGSGSGANMRWLAPRISGAQVWWLIDQDRRLLELAEQTALTAADGAPVTVETRCADLTRLTTDDFTDASLVSASALLDLLTADEVRTLVDTVAAAGTPALFALSVTGRVECEPSDPGTAAITAAFNGHQQRPIRGRGRLLGPSAPAVTTDAFRRHGWTVVAEPSPWRLDATHADLQMRWLTEWCAAAAEHDQHLVPTIEAAMTRWRTAWEAGTLRIVVHHVDLLAIPPGR